MSRILSTRGLGVALFLCARATIAAEQEPLVPDAIDTPAPSPTPERHTAPTPSAGGRKPGSKGVATSKKQRTATEPAGKEHASTETASPDGLCTVAYTRAQKDEQSGHLREARDLLLTCAIASCGPFLFKECTARHAILEADIPSIVPLAEDRGVPIVDVAVTMDGSPVVSHLDGHAIPVDPGLHEVAFSARGKVFATRKVLIAEGQRNRPITVSRDEGAASTATTPSEDHPNARPGTHPSALPYVLGSAGLAVAGAGALLVYWGRRDDAALGQCSPSCSESSLNHIKTLYLTGDIAMGAGVVALGLATWRFFATPRPTADETPVRPGAYGFDVHPARSGAFAAVSRTF